MDLKPGDRVRTPQGHAGRVASVDGKYVVVAEDDGFSWRGRADDCVKMAASVHVPEREESTMASAEPVSDKMLRVMIGSPNVYGESLRNEAFRRGFRSAGRSIEDVVTFLKSALHMSMDLTEVEVSPDGGVEVCVDPSGDEARAGVLTYERSAACPYCSKSAALFDGRLGDHRVPGGVCDGSGKKVARVEMGRAVLSAFASKASATDRARTEASVGGSREGMYTVVFYLPSNPDNFYWKWSSSSEITEAGAVTVAAFPARKKPKTPQL